MHVKAADGTMFEIEVAEAKRIHDEMSKHLPPGAKKHEFKIDGASVWMAEADMKRIADTWWEHYGKSRMTDFFEKYQEKAADHIREALGHTDAPTCEDEVKAAIAQAIDYDNPDLIAEVLFEAMEWETAYSGLESIKN